MSKRKLFPTVVFIFLFSAVVLYAEEVLSKEDQEIVQDLEFFENAEIFLNGDVSLLQNYEDVERLNNDEGERDANETK